MRANTCESSGGIIPERRRSPLRAPTVALALLLAMALVGPMVSSPSAGADSVTATVGQPITLDGEQAHTVVQVQRWYGGGYWMPPAGKASVSIDIKIEGRAKTSYNALYYSLEGATGAAYGRVIIGPRYPALHSSNDLMAGDVVDGWLTFLVPTTQLGGLKLIYHMHSGFGSTLTVPLGNVANSPRAQMGRTAIVAGEQALTVLRVERPAKVGFYKPKSGYVFVTVFAQLRALKTTKTGDFTSFSSNGATHGDVLLSHRSPTLPTGRSLARGKVVSGWVTMMVPKSQSHGLTLVYHLSDNRDTWLIGLPG